jgi:hypothetical protein
MLVISLVFLVNLKTFVLDSHVDGSSGSVARVKMHSEAIMSDGSMLSCLRDTCANAAPSFISMLRAFLLRPDLST